jgi:TonB family protein
MRSAAIVLVAALSGSAFCAEPLPVAVCDAQLTPPDFLQGLYPPGARRRSETGTVTLELKIDVSATRPVEVAIVKSSGIPDLDTAALRIGNALLVSCDCLNATVLRAIHFEKEPDPPRPSMGDYFLTGETYIWVEEL